MQPNRPSPFFRRTQLQRGQSDPYARLAARRRVRRAVALFSIVAGIALAVGASLYLATPHQPLEWRALWAHPKAPAVQATPLTSEPGAVGLQVQRGKQKHVFRFRQAGEGWTIEDVTAAAKQRPQKTSPHPLPVTAPGKQATPAP